MVSEFGSTSLKDEDQNVFPRGRNVNSPKGMQEKSWRSHVAFRRRVVSVITNDWVTDF